jgi:1-acyl-sn-glycerol-3-phosphate acyltransferase
MSAGYVRPRPFPYWFTTLGLRFFIGAYLRLRVEGQPNLPPGPAILCFNHQDWLDPFVIVAALPARPTLIFFGPKEVDMTVGAKNRIITWSGRGLPFNPGHNDLLAATRSVRAALSAGVRVAIAPEGRIHAGERALLPLAEGVAYFALRCGVPVVPVGITGLGWVRWGKTVRLRIGTPIEPAGRASREAIRSLTGRIEAALLDLVADGRDEEPPGPVGRWITEVFNDWPEGARPAPLAPGVARGAD